ncbi:hypothetical protein MRX96_017547 [Rhipicephalus microplus]
MRSSTATARRLQRDPARCEDPIGGLGRRHVNGLALGHVARAVRDVLPCSSPANQRRRSRRSGDLSPVRLGVLGCIMVSIRMHARLQPNRYRRQCNGDIAASRSPA